MQIKKIVARCNEFVIYQTTDGYSVLDREKDDYLRIHSSNIEGVSVFRNWLILEAAQAHCEALAKEKGWELQWQTLA
jgi:hypothetical protein